MLARQCTGSFLCQALSLLRGRLSSIYPSGQGAFSFLELAACGGSQKEEKDFMWGHPTPRQRAAALCTSAFSGKKKGSSAKGCRPLRACFLWQEKRIVSKGLPPSARLLSLRKRDNIAAKGCRPLRACFLWQEKRVVGKGL
ncbi:MAG TPA: hypothetical protein VF458_12440, partial [Ktedonobacteraceae bacterium]